MATYLYRQGDGNEGNFPRFLVTLADGENPYAALRAFVLNAYIANTRTRRHIAANIIIDGEPEYGLHATVFDGPRHETAFESAWLTAEFQPLSDADAAHYRDQNMSEWTLATGLDRGARLAYKKHA